MPYYGIPVGQTDEDVAMGFNKAIITGLARQQYGYDGVICTDWGLLTDHPLSGYSLAGAGVGRRASQRGGAGAQGHRGGRRSIWRRKLRALRRRTGAEWAPGRGAGGRNRCAGCCGSNLLGLFDDPFVDETEVAQVMEHPAAVAAGLASQQRAMTLLKNTGDVLPLVGRPKIYVKNIDPAVAGQYAELSPRRRPPISPSCAWTRPGFPSRRRIPLRAAFITAISISRSQLKAKSWRCCTAFRRLS
jgi:beta-glucosidase